MNVREQYKSADNLNARIVFQGKYSVNKQGFSNWLKQQYDFPQGAKVLELGCGTGGLWADESELITNRLGSLTLSDFSEGMLTEARKTLGDKLNVSFRVIDATSIPLADNSFDVVIANMMLYHVPDRRQAIAEIARVLKPDGRLYCATFGEGNLADIAHELLCGLCDVPAPSHDFTLDNGAEQLEASFGQVDMRLYPDSFRITSVEDVLSYVESFSVLSPENRETAREILLKQFDEHGVWEVPKRYGTFVAEAPRK